MLRICSLCVLVLLLPLAGLATPAAPVITGDIRVIDGDTLAVGGQTLRLHGIDALEVDQRCSAPQAPRWSCGAWVRDAVRALYQGRQATCTVLDHDRYGRAVATCLVDGQDIGADLVGQGLAFAYRRYSQAYDLTEKQAAVAGRGLHGLGVVPPADHRAARAAAQAAQAAQTTQTDQAPAGCAIKGNITTTGQRIYHSPGQQWYARTRIATARGERWFCSEAEARAAGWRPAAR